MAKNMKTGRPKKEAVAQFEMLRPMLKSLLYEIREFAKKKPDGVLNKLKVNTINRALKDVKAVLGEDPTVGYLDLLDEESLPQNSDAVLILGQYDAAMTHFQEKHHGYDSSTRGWFTSGGFVADKDIE